MIYNHKGMQNFKKKHVTNNKSMVAHSELYEKVKVILSNMHITQIICINPTFSSSNTHT